MEAATMVSATESTRTGEWLVNFLNEYDEHGFCNYKLKIFDNDGMFYKYNHWNCGTLACPPP